MKACRRRKGWFFMPPETCVTVMHSDDTCDPPSSAHPPPLSHNSDGRWCCFKAPLYAAEILYICPKKVQGVIESIFQG